MSIEISTDRARLDVRFVHRYLSEESYWARGRSLETVQATIDNSLCFGAYEDGRQIGFARIVTDRAVFGYLADVFVAPEHRGRGVATRLMADVLANPMVDSLPLLRYSEWQMLHGLDQRFGFASLKEPSQMMARRPADLPPVYARRASRSPLQTEPQRRTAPPEGHLVVIDREGLCAFERPHEDGVELNAAPQKTRVHATDWNSTDDPSSEDHLPHELQSAMTPRRPLSSRRSVYRDGLSTAAAVPPGSCIATSCQFRSTTSEGPTGLSPQAIATSPAATASFKRVTSATPFMASAFDAQPTLALARSSSAIRAVRASCGVLTGWSKPRRTGRGPSPVIADISKP